VTGVTTMKIDEGLDTGDILLKREMEIHADDTVMTLAPKLATLGADLLVETLDRLQQGSLRSIPQDDALATLAPILKKEDGLIDFNRSAREIHNRLRGFQPWPATYTRFRGKNLKILNARVSDRIPPLAPGELHASGNELFVGCGNATALELLQVQLEGKNATPARDFISGYHPAEGERLG
jgi:methionyl-tRNA formyltransferase